VQAAVPVADRNVTNAPLLHDGADLIQVRLRRTADDLGGHHFDAFITADTSMRLADLVGLLVGHFDLADPLHPIHASRQVDQPLIDPLDGRIDPTG